MIGVNYKGSKTLSAKGVNRFFFNDKSSFINAVRNLKIALLKSAIFETLFINFLAITSRSKSTAKFFFIFEVFFNLTILFYLENLVGGFQFDFKPPVTSKTFIEIS